MLISLEAEEAGTRLLDYDYLKDYCFFIVNSTAVYLRYRLVGLRPNLFGF